MFEQRSEDYSYQDRRLGYDMMVSPPEPPAPKPKKRDKEKEAKLFLELGNMKEKSNREMRFMDKIRSDALNRRRAGARGEFHLTLTGLKNDAATLRHRKYAVGGRARRNIVSARTTDRERQ